MMLPEKKEQNMQEFAGRLTVTERGRTFYLSVYVTFVDDEPDHVFITEGHNQHSDFPFGSPGEHEWELAAQKLVESKMPEIEVTPPGDMVIDEDDDPKLWH